MPRLKGKVAVVTGGADGIGKATCEVFGREGAAVVVADVNVEKGQAVARDNHLPRRAGALRRNQRR